MSNVFRTEFPRGTHTALLLKVSGVRRRNVRVAKSTRRKAEKSAPPRFVTSQVPPPNARRRGERNLFILKPGGQCRDTRPYSGGAKTFCFYPMKMLSRWPVPCASTVYDPSAGTRFGSWPPSRNGSGGARKNNSKDFRSPRVIQVKRKLHGRPGRYLGVAKSKWRFCGF